MEQHGGIMPESPGRFVFVYGTLRRGGRNDINRLQPAPRHVGMGEVAGVLYHFDWYPGLTLGGSEAVNVVGEVYEIGAALEAVLDGIEGIEEGDASEYLKREVDVEVDGASVRCLVYEINARRVKDLAPIPHRDWIEFHKM